MKRSFVYSYFNIFNSTSTEEVYDVEHNAFYYIGSAKISSARAQLVWLKKFNSMLQCFSTLRVATFLVVPPAF